ncbi:MAG: TIGR02281 family clan AA aspartic protease [Burkholderiaceae bacterium]|nr:MAG: TIGR02281 family clan AA aspartic protease [Burkholderiaceae bacterium]
MAIGFIKRSWQVLWLRLLRPNHYRIAAGLFILGTALGTTLSSAQAQEINVGVAGLFPPNKVLLSMDGQTKVVAVGSSLNGVKVISVEESGATLEINGRKEFVSMGSHYAAIAGRGSDSANAKSITLSADARGHFFATGTINGGYMQFLVDTGASSIALGIEDARRLGIKLDPSRVGYSNTANGVTAVYKVTLTEVNVEGIVLYGIEAVVLENMHGMALLGMSFLNRMDMKRDGQTMTLTKRY